jgi:hypothetical protein
MGTALAEGEQKIETVTRLTANLGVFLAENEYVSAEDATVEPFKKTNQQQAGSSKTQQSKQTAKPASGQGGQRPQPKPYSNPHPRRPKWVLKVMRLYI